MDDKEFNERIGFIKRAGEALQNKGIDPKLHVSWGTMIKSHCDELLRDRCEGDVSKRVYSPSDPEIEQCALDFDTYVQDYVATGKAHSYSQRLRKRLALLLNEHCC